MGVREQSTEKNTWISDKGSDGRAEEISYRESSEFVLLAAKLVG
jgi:hypothetical protein